MLVALSLLTGGRAAAGSLYEQALAAYDRVEYGEAVRLIDRALPTESLSPAEVERAYFVLGSALLGDGQVVRAERAFQTLVALRPGYRAERDASPKVVDAIRRARVAVGATAPSIHHDPLQRVVSGEVTIEAEVTAAAALEPAVEYRLTGDPAAARAKLRCAGTRCEAKLPTSTRSYRLGFVTAEGALVLPTGDYRVAVADLAQAPRERQPLYKKWWLWTTVGVVVVGAVVGTAVGVSLNQKAAHSIDFSISKDCGRGASCPLWTSP